MPKVANGFAHESAYNESQEWYTPPSIFDALGLRFDLDVASPGADVVPWIPADKHFTFEDSGLLQRWTGCVWCNPPYGTDTAIWVEKFCQHQNGVMLVFSRTDTAWFQKHARRADVLCFVKGRVKFRRHDGFCGAGSGAGSLLIAFGEQSVYAVQNSKLGVCMETVGAAEVREDAAAGSR